MKKWLAVIASVGLAVVSWNPAYAAPKVSGGEKIYFIEGTTYGESTLLGRINPDGSNKEILTKRPGDYHDPKVSPNGDKIVYVNISVPALMLSNPDASNAQQLTMGWNPSWFPNGQKLAYEGYGTNGNDIYTVNVDGTGVTNLTNTPNVNEYEPAVSPDGTKIVFTRKEVTTNGIVGGTFVMNSDGTGVTKISDQYVSQPEWSPDGSKIVFEYQGDVYTMNPDGTNWVNLTADVAEPILTPVWSPDGSKIAFSTYLDSNSYSYIYTMNPDGSGKTAILKETSVKQLGSWGKVNQ